MTQRPQRIMIVNGSLRIGGVERKIVDLAGNWSRSPDAPELDIVLSTGPSRVGAENIFLERAQQSRAWVHCRPSTPLVPFSLYLLWWIWRVQPDVLLAYGSRAALLAVLVRRLPGRRRLRVVMGNDTVRSQAIAIDFGSHWMRKVYTAQLQFVYTRVDLILVPSEASRRDMVEALGAPAEKIRVVQNWVTLPDEPAGEALYDLIYVGRIAPVKRLIQFVEIAACMRQKRPGLRVAIVGDGSEMADVRRAANRLDLGEAIDFVGFQADPGSFYARARIFCLTSWTEGMPLAGLEAMAHSLPIVALAYPGADELIQPGQTGYICDTPAAFCEVALDLLEDEVRRAQLGQHARAVAEQKHGVRVLAEYARLIAEGV